MKINKDYRNQIRNFPNEGIYDLENKKHRENFYKANRIQFEISKKKKKEKLDKFLAISGLIVFNLLFLGTGAYIKIDYRKEKNKFHQNPKVQKVDSMYHAQKEFYENRLDSLKQDYVMKLNKLERDLE